MKLKKILFFSLILLTTLSVSLFANGAKELTNETPVKVLNKSVIDGVTNLLVVTETGSQILYRADSETISNQSQDFIQIGDILSVKDNGIAAMSFPPQMWIDEFRIITAGARMGAYDLSFPEVEELLSPFFADEVELEEGYMWDVEVPQTMLEKFNYAYGYLNMKSFIEQGMILYAGAFGRGIADSAAGLESLLSTEEMNAAIDAYVDDIISTGAIQTAGPQYYSYEEVSNLAIGESVEERFAYAYGYLITNQSLGQGIEILPQWFAEGCLTAWYIAEPVMTEDDMIAAFNEYSNYLNEQYNAYVGELAATNLNEAETFLSYNAQEPQMYVSEDGKVQFEFVTLGDPSGVKPLPTDTVNVNYQLLDINGNVLDQGMDVDFPLPNLISGFASVVCEMVPGDFAIAYIHPDYGYGAEGSGPVQPNSLLVFYIELLGIVTE